MNQASFPISKARIVSWSALAIALLISQTTLMWFVRNPGVVLICNEIALLAVLTIAIWISARNALSGRRSCCLFWVFVAGGSALWALNSLLGSVFVTRHWRGSPGLMVAGTVLFLHTAMLLAAVVSKPHAQHVRQGIPVAALNSLIFLSFWILMYVVLMTPGGFRNWNSVTTESFLIVYSVTNITLMIMTATFSLRAHGHWRAIYWSLFGASAIFVTGSIHGGLFPDLPNLLSTAAACLLVLAAVLGTGLGSKPEQLVLAGPGAHFADGAAMLVATTVPLFCAVVLLRRSEPGNVGTVRQLVVLAAGLLFVTAAFVIEFLVHRWLSRDIAFANDQLDLALHSGRSIVWDLNVATGEGDWVGDLETFFGIPARAASLPVEQFYRSIHPEDSPRVSHAISDALFNARPFAAVFRLALPQGAVLWVKSHGRFYYNASGDATRMVGTVLDISEQKRIESVLRETELRFRNVADRAPVLLWMSTRDQLCDYFNKSWLDFTGRPLDAELGNGWMSSIHPGDRGRYIEVSSEAFAGGKPFSIEYRLRRHDGEYRWILVNAVPRFAFSSAFEGYIGSATDVTEIKRAEDVLQKSEEEFSLAFEAAHLGWWVWNEETWRVSNSEGARTIFGLPGGSETTLEEFLDCVHPEDRDRVYETWRRAIETGSYFLAEYRTVWPDGTIHWVESRGRSYLPSQGKPPQMIGVIMEVTERKNTEETLRTLNGRLIAAQEEERVRIARELHDDVCQRLAVIGIELLRMKDEPQLSEPRLQKWAGDLAQLTGQVADDLQALSHELHTSTLEILGVTATMRNFCAQFAERHDVQIEFSSSSVPFLLPQDVSVCLYRILQEGLRNAGKHSRADHLCVELRGERGAAELIIRDSGVGFDSEKAAKGQGLGLISMRERVNLLKGTFSIESRPKRGTTIRARVPVQEMNAAQCA